MSQPLKIITLCTGNVARSVMLGYMLTTIAESNGYDWQVRSAGTHVIQGSSMSARTRDALMRINELGDRHYGAHRSHQLDADDATWADVILASEANHVRFVRRNFPEDADKAVLLGQFVREAPLEGTFAVQLDVVAQHEPLATLDVTDPAGGDQSTYNECAGLLWDLSQVFATLVAEHDVD
jgi:protein-tyrosine-phosphatase